MKQKDILIIIVLLFIFAIAWIGSSIYHSAVSSTISENTTKDIAPIAPSFDLKTVDKLRRREKINPSFDLERVTPTPIIVLPTQASPNDSSGGKLLL